MGDETPQTPLLSVQEQEAIDIFFKSFGRALVAAQMYFKDHPSYGIAVHELKDRYVELKAYRAEIAVAISPDTVFVDGAPFFPKNARYLDLAQRLHRLHIAGLRFFGDADAVAFAGLIYAIVHYDAFRSEGKGWDEIFGGLSGIEVKDLDYSRLFAGSGGCSGDVWKLIFDDTQIWDDTAVETVAEHIDEITAALVQAGGDERAAEKAVAGFERLAEKSKTLQGVKKKQVSKALYSFFTSSSAAASKAYAHEGSCEKIKAFIRENLDEDELIGGLLSSVQQTGSVNGLFVSFYNGIAAQNASMEDVADVAAKHVREKLSPAERARLAEVAGELFLSNSSDAFVSRFYQRSLDFSAGVLSKEPSEICEKYRALFVDAELESDVFAMLLDMLIVSADVQEASVILTMLVPIVKARVKAGDLSAVSDVFCAWDRVKSTGGLHAAVIAERLAVAIEIDFLVKDVLLVRLSEINDTDVLRSLTVYLGQDQGVLIERYFSESVPTKAEHLKKLLLGLDGSFVLDKVSQLFKRAKNDKLQALKVIALLSDMKTQGAAEELACVMSAFRDDSYLLTEAARAYRANRYADADALAERIGDSVYEVRKEAVLLAATHASPEKRQLLADAMLVVGGFFGSKDALLRENIDFCQEARLTEAAGHLAEIVVKIPFFSFDRRDVVREAAARALLTLDPAVFDTVRSALAADINPRMRALAKKEQP